MKEYKFDLSNSPKRQTPEEHYLNVFNSIVEALEAHKEFWSKPVYMTIHRLHVKNRYTTWTETFYGKTHNINESGGFETHSYYIAGVGSVSEKEFKDFKYNDTGR